MFATIPAGIYAKTHYNDILANVDWLHGLAESLLTVTNLLICVGMRDAMPPADSPAVAAGDPGPKARAPAAAGVAAASLAAGSLGLALAAHAEPANALSLPTWVIHVSSLIEWLVAMGLVWRYAEASGNPRWRGLTWGMLPLHSSGICACTFHLFYNAPSLNLLVAIQAALTCFGNGTMAYAAYRISKYKRVDALSVKMPSADVEDSRGARQGPGLVGFEDLAGSLVGDANVVFLAKLFALSVAGSVAVKYGELYVDGVFHPAPAAALAIIIVPSALNMAKWAVRSKAPDSKLGKFL